MSRFVEFFEDDNQRLSMSRLLCGLSFFPASYVVIISASGDTLGWYLAAYTGAYVGGKVSDMLGRPRDPGPGSNVTINQPDKVNVSGS